MSCYYICGLQAATAIGLDQQLDPQAVRGQQHAALDAELVRLCVARRNPLQAPLSPLGLLNSLNPCLVLGGQPIYDNLNGWDAAYFFSTLLGELDLLPGFMVETLEEGVCQLCGNQSQQVPFPSCFMILEWPSGCHVLHDLVHLHSKVTLSFQAYTAAANHSYMLSLTPPGQLGPLDLGQLLGAVRGAPPVPTLTCQHRHCPAYGARGMPTHLVATPGRVMVVHLARLQQTIPGQQLQQWQQQQQPGQQQRPGQQQAPTVKVLTPVALPPPNHQEYPGLQARVVLAHTPGHWIGFVNVAGIWWRTDGQGVQQEDPWARQCDPAVSPRGYTVDVVFFTQ